MHYQVVRIDDEGEHVDPALTFDRQELAVYIDRRVFERQVPRLELSIVRCDVDGRERRRRTRACSRSSSW